ncbi:MAG: YkgJ family cysteine cluster protein [Candidatus Margulisiibacteriota bacterium]
MLKKTFFVIRWLVIISNAYYKFLERFFFKPRYDIIGECIQCGRCCEVIGIQDTEHTSSNRFLRKLIIGFYEKIYGFKFLEYHPEHKMFMFACSYFDKVAKKCTNYRHRPAICRNYPTVQFFIEPEIVKPCGYDSAPRKCKRK